MTKSILSQVNYEVLDDAKRRFIAAGRETLDFASKYGFVPDGKFGASANIFALNISEHLSKKVESLAVTLVPEGLGTADDARPEDLTEVELEKFWFNIAGKAVGAITNDVASSGIQPVLLSLYLPVGNAAKVFTKPFLSGFTAGIVDAARRVGCVYFSGETPELRGKLYEDKIDVAGCCFGIVPAGSRHINSSDLDAGDTIVFVGSSGPHENGFTPLRTLVNSLKDGYRTKLPSGVEYWQAINEPSVLYSPLIRAIIDSGVYPTNAEPVSGHGWQKLMRSSKSLEYVIEELLPVPEIFTFVEQASSSTPAEMIRVFNYGVGLALFFRSRSDAEKAVSISAPLGYTAKIVGSVKSSNARKVSVLPLQTVISDQNFNLCK